MRRKYFVIISLIVFAIALVVASIFWYWRTTVQAEKIAAPFSLPDTTISLSNQLVATGLVLETPPTILGDTLTASISGARVLFDKNQNFETQIRTLQLVLPRFKMENGKFTQIDLRFSKVVFR